MKHAARVDDDRLTGHGFGAAHRDDHVEAAEPLGDVADEPGDRRVINDVAAGRGGVDLVARCQLARDAIRLVAALCLHDGDVRSLPRQRVTNALPRSALAACYKCGRAFEVHEMSPASDRLRSDLWRGQAGPPEFSKFIPRPGPECPSASWLPAIPRARRGRRGRYGSSGHPPNAGHRRTAPA